MDLLDLFVKIGVKDEASDAVSGISSKLKNGLATAGKVAAAGVTAATTAVGALSKVALDSYSNYEQLVGGVETLYGNAGKSMEQYVQEVADQVRSRGFEPDLEGIAERWKALEAVEQKVLENASEAYRTAGLSANQYMETITGFTAALSQTIDDTSVVADYADMAVRDMSDNANKMGTSMEMIQNAYQGFAKQNYTMLDNLKLGYGGTAAEMARLINDSGVLGDTVKVTAKTMNAVSFDKIIEAINVVQTNMGITGTTAKEASTTIEGSVNSAKAAWSNLVTGIANENADLNTLIGNFVQSAETAAGNIIPRLTQILSGMGSAIEQIAPVLSTQIPAIVTQVLPPMVSAGSQLLVGLINGLISATPQLLAAVPGIVHSVAQSIQGSGPSIMQAGQQLLSMIQSGIINGLPVLAESASTIMGNFGSYLQQNLPSLLQSGLSAVSILSSSIRENAGVLVDGALALAQSLAQGLADSIPTIVENVPTIVSNIAGVINDNAPKIFSAAANIMSKLAKGLISAIPTIVANLPQIINAIVDVLLAFNWINLGTSVIKGFANGIKSMVAFVKNSANGIGTAVKNGLASLPAEMVNIGKNIIQGLINGVKSLASAVKSNIKSVVGGAVSTVKNFLGIHSPSTVFYSIGEYIMQGLELGLQDSAGNVMETVENIVAELKKRFDTIANIYTTRQDISDLEYQLWEGSEGKSATEVEKYAKKLQLLTKQQNDQQNVVDAAVAAYQKIVEQYGDNTQESYEYQKTLLEEQLELQNLQNEIYDTVAAMQELSKAKSGMSSVSFGESGLGTATSATINATESVADREISASFTANLVTPDGSKLASWQLPYLIKAGSAAGTPIAEAQRA